MPTDLAREHRRRAVMNLDGQPDIAGRTANPFAIVPVWILDPGLYLPGVPDRNLLRRGDEKPLTGSEVRVYIALKSFADRDGHCHPHMSTVASRAGVDQSSAERAVAKFKRLGWVTSKRNYREKDDARWISGCDYWIAEDCPTPLVTSEVPVKPRVPYPRTGGYPTREATGAMNTPREDTNPTDLGNDPISTTSSRSAPSGGGAAENEDRSWVARDLNQLRESDFELFKSLVGDRIQSTGNGFTQGTFNARQVYLGLMRWKGGKKKTLTWPGAVLQKVDNDGIGEGLEYFLSSYGLVVLGHDVVSYRQPSWRTLRIGLCHLAAP